MGCQVEIANKIIVDEADSLLALKGNQPTFEADVENYFSSAPADKLVTKTTVEKGHGRIDTRVYAASQEVDWIVSERSYPGQPRFTNINAPSTPIAAPSPRATSSVPHCSTSTVLPTAYGATGASKACTGSWMSSSTTICRATEPATVPKTWPSSDAPPSASYAPTRPREASKPVESAPAGTRNSCSKSSSSNDR